MPYIRDRVVVLKKEPFREQDRRYVMYGRAHGLLTAVARGSASVHSKQAGHLEPLTVSDVMIAKGAAFDKLAVARAVRVPHPSSADVRLATNAVCGAACDLVVRLTRPGIVDERISDLLEELADVTGAMPSAPSPERARFLHAGVTLRLLDLLGFAPPIAQAEEGTTPVAGLVLVSFMRQSPLSDLLRVTAPSNALLAASGFVAEALKQTPLEREPHGEGTIRALLAVR